MATLSVYWCGTAGSIEHKTTQVSLFYTITKGIDLTDIHSLEQLDSAHSLEDGHDKQYRMAFDGCGHTRGFMGTIFATGLGGECETVVSKIKILESYLMGLEKENPRPLKGKLRVNVLGLSRGGMAALLLAKAITAYKLQGIELNLLLFDPVPGNLVTSAKLDVFSRSLCNQCMDLRHCLCVNDVLALYPHEPLPDLAFHAPILPRYPSGANVVEDVVLGCHQGALFYPRSTEGQLSFARIRRFLQAHGTVLEDALAPPVCRRIDDKFCKGLMDKAMQRRTVSKDQCTTRAVHSYEPATIVCHATARTFLNLHHLEVAQRLGSASEEQSTLTFLLEIARPGRERAPSSSSLSSSLKS